VAVVMPAIRTKVGIPVGKSKQCRLTGRELSILGITGLQRTRHLEIPDSGSARGRVRVLSSSRVSASVAHSSSKLHTESLPGSLPSPGGFTAPPRHRKRNPTPNARCRPSRSKSHPLHRRRPYAGHRCRRETSPQGQPTTCCRLGPSRSRHQP